MLIIFNILFIIVKTKKLFFVMHLQWKSMEHNKSMKAWSLYCTVLHQSFIVQTAVVYG